MSVRNVVRVVVKLGVILCITIGLLLQMGIFSGSVVFTPFYTYTGLISVFVALYELVTIIEMFRSKGSHNFVPWWQFAALIGALCNMELAYYTGNTGGSGHGGTALFLLNVLVPCAMAFEWLFLTPKGSFKEGYPWIGCLPIYIYMIIIAAGPSIGIGFENYGVLNIASEGIISGILRFVQITMTMLGCGYFIESLDRFCASKHIL